MTVSLAKEIEYGMYILELNCAITPIGVQAINHAHRCIIHPVFGYSNIA